MPDSLIRGKQAQQILLLAQRERGIGSPVSDTLAVRCVPRVRPVGAVWCGVVGLGGCVAVEL